MQLRHGSRFIAHADLEEARSYCDWADNVRNTAGRSVHHP
jgi:hypothetical protein